FITGTPSLVLSLHLPEDKSESKKEKEEEKEKKEKPISVPTPDSTKTIAGEKPLADPEKEAFEKRRNESLKEHRAQAATLAKSGVPFSFGTMSIKTTDFSKNVQLMVEQGLTEEQALNALTMQPAKLLGIEKHAGSIEAGKMANIIISNKPIFEKDVAIRYMIVEGDLYEYEIKEKKKKASGISKDSVDVIVGTWKYSIETPDQTREGTFEFSKDGEEITGKIKSNDITSGNDELEEVVLEEDKLSFTFDFELNGQIILLEFDLTLKGETFDGTVSSKELGSFPVTGDRITKPNQ
ncbi:MAG TPA: amidohydrolase family protein, partial [Saprospiraceae bacterium]|nr:amidohydrolase family protein [Saprospiraceae bacterium]